MAVLIDTSILIAHERGTLDVLEAVADRQEEDFYLSVISASELLHGVHRAREPAVAARRAAFVEGVLGTFPLAPIDLSVARAHARLWADLATGGTPVGAHDLWLAATCVANGWSLATSNVREFRRVSGLTVEEW
jgi:tRNA(fMet)-specific endonuclease VapC